MKIPSITLAALVLTVALTEAGSFGPGPWANGAYYPGQFDGVYSATAYGNNLGGVIGFALKGGAPTTISNDLTTIIDRVDPTANYYAIYVKGLAYVGTTIGNVNNVAKTVNAALVGGIDTHNTGTWAADLNQSAGYFSADLKSDNAIVKFVGNNTGVITLQNPTGLSPLANGTNTFSLSGLKVSQ